MNPKQQKQYKDFKSKRDWYDSKMMQLLIADVEANIDDDEKVITLYEGLNKCTQKKICEVSIELETLFASFYRGEVKYDDVAEKIKALIAEKEKYIALLTSNAEVEQKQSIKLGVMN